jgi:hypothetical protein
MSGSMCFRFEWRVRMFWWILSDWTPIGRRGIKLGT